MSGINKDKLPTFKPGERLSAGKLNALAEPLRQQSLAPGSFQSGAFNVQRRTGGAAAEVAESEWKFCYVTEEVSGATGKLPEDWGVGMVQFHDDLGVLEGAEEQVLNRYYSNILVDAPGWCRYVESLSAWVVHNFDCRTEP